MTAQNLPTANDWESLPAHPRLFANPADWDRVRANITSDPFSTRLFTSIRTECDALLDTPPVALVKEGRRLLEPVRTAQARIFRLALVARLTDDNRYSRRAIEEMRHLAQAPDWNPSHFLDVAEAALALGTGYDWLYDQLSAEDRKLIADAIINKALLPSLGTPNGRPLYWIKGTNNWNQVCHGGLTAGALAIAEYDPDLARRITDRAIANLHTSAEAYAPDGAYPEGPMYWGYGTTFHVVLIEVLRTALGTTAGMDAFPGFLESADYMRQVTMPSGRFYAYSDGYPSKRFNPPLFWFARRLNRPDLVVTEIEKYNSIRAGACHDRFLPFTLLWRDPEQTAPTVAGPLSWFALGHNPLGIHRSAWNDPRAVYLAIKGGSPSVNHGHMDVGSFVIESDGVIWAADIGAQDYHSLESTGIKLFNSAQDSARWNVFRLGAESHNIIRFDGQPQITGAYAKPGRHRETGENPFTQFDLSPLYSGQVADITRGVRLRDDHRIVIQDEWTALPGKPVNIAWQWLTYADVTVDGRSIRLTENGEHFAITVQTPVDARIEVEDMAAPQASYDAPNPDLKRIRIQLKTEAGQSGHITILATPGSAPTDLPTPAARPLAEW